MKTGIIGGAMGLAMVLAVAAFSQGADLAAINRHIAKQAAEEQGEEYKKARKIVRGDVDGDGTEDLAVLYTIEGQQGSNNYVQYLAVFLRVKEKLVAVADEAVGGKMSRSMTLQAIKDGEILFRTMEYTEMDGACCPSKPGRTRFRLVDRKLKEQP